MEKANLGQLKSFVPSYSDDDTVMTGR